MTQEKGGEYTRIEEYLVERNEGSNEVDNAADLNECGSQHKDKRASFSVHRVDGGSLEIQLTGHNIVKEETDIHDEECFVNHGCEDRAIGLSSSVSELLVVRSRELT